MINDPLGRPLEERRALLEEVLFESRDSLRVSEFFDGDGLTLFRHAGALNLEGIVSKRQVPLSLGSVQIAELSLALTPHGEDRCCFNG